MARPYVGLWRRRFFRLCRRLSRNWTIFLMLLFAFLAGVIAGSAGLDTTVWTTVFFALTCTHLIIFQFGHAAFQSLIRYPNTANHRAPDAGLWKFAVLFFGLHKELRAAIDERMIRQRSELGRVE